MNSDYVEFFSYLLYKLRTMRTIGILNYYRDIITSVL